MAHLTPFRLFNTTDKENNWSYPSPSSCTDDLGTFRLLQLDDQTTVSFVPVNGLIAMVLLQASIVPGCTLVGAVVETQDRIAATDDDPRERFLIRVAEVPAVGGDQMALAVRELEQLRAEVALAPVVGELERIQAQPGLPPLMKPLANRSFQDGGMRSRPGVADGSDLRASSTSACVVSWPGLGRRKLTSWYHSARITLTHSTHTSKIAYQGLLPCITAPFRRCHCSSNAGAPIRAQHGARGFQSDGFVGARCAVFRQQS